nr:unnamed protein product [Callosobruchus analis]
MRERRRKKTFKLAYPEPKIVAQFLTDRKLEEIILNDIEFEEGPRLSAGLQDSDSDLSDAESEHADYDTESEQEFSDCDSIQDNSDETLSGDGDVSSVDSWDQKCASYSGNRRSRRWPLTNFFCHTKYLDCKLPYTIDNPRKFNVLLGKALKQKYLQERLPLNISREMKNMIRKVLGIAEQNKPDATDLQPPHSKRMRCVLCPRSKIERFQWCIQNVENPSSSNTLNRHLSEMPASHHWKCKREHNSDETLSGDGDVSNEEASLYLSTKSDVDSLDQKCASYSGNRRSRRWPLTNFFCHTKYLDCKLPYTIDNPRKFNVLLGKALIQKYLQERLPLNISREMKNMIRKVLGIAEQNQPDATDLQPPHSKRMRCVLCPRSKIERFQWRIQNVENPSSSNTLNRHLSVMPASHHWKCKRERRCHFFNNILIEIFLNTRSLMKSEETIIGGFGKVRISV